MACTKTSVSTGRPVRLADFNDPSLTPAQMVALRSAREVTRISELEEILERAGYVRNSRDWTDAIRVAGEVWKIQHSASPLR